jgi:uncharacterized protein YjiS (DUF1127 family)
MATSYHVSISRQTFASIELGLSLLGGCYVALHDWRERRRIRARLVDLSDRELHDIGISRGEIDYVALNGDIDPRGIRQCPD